MILRREQRALRVDHPGRIYTRDQLMDAMYRDERVVADRTVDSHVKKIRRKLAAVLPEREVLHSVYGIWRQIPKRPGSIHWGSRLVFRPDGTRFVTLGDRRSHDHVQDLASTIGKVVRINPNGTIPGDNPFVGRDGVRPEIWSSGHRNAQAAALDGGGRLWMVEHGAMGGDELNQPQAGRNYGWPVITYGVDYSGAKIGEGTAKAGMEQPVYYWDPVIAPSGATFYSGSAFPAWRGDLLVGSLRPGGLVRLRIVDGRVAEETHWVVEPDERVRDVRQGPDGLVYLLTDSPRGRLIRLEPR